MKKLTPVQLALIALLTGLGLITSAIYVLTNIGYAMLVLSIPFIAFSLFVFRGILKQSRLNE